MKRYCTVCGKSEAEHETHQPAWIEFPDACVCDPGTWIGGTNKVDPICEKYQGNDEQYCNRCAHDKECHKKSD